MKIKRIRIFQFVLWASVVLLIINIVRIFNETVTQSTVLGIISNVLLIVGMALLIYDLKKRKVK